MKIPNETLASLRESVSYHEGHLAVLRLAEQCLSFPYKGCVYQVHIQAGDPAHRSIMAEGTNLLDLCCQARRLDMEYNIRGRSALEVFIRCGDVLMMMQPGDAMEELPEEARQEFTFHLDERFSRVPSRQLVFKVGAPLPSGHYALKPTPEREPVLAGPGLVG